MAGVLQPLDEKFAIVGSDGRPTLYFIKWAQQRQLDIAGGITLQDLIDYLVAHSLQEGSGIQITPNGQLPSSPTIAADVQEILDQITATRGAMLYRGLLGWSALLPGTSGFFLKTNGPGADPAWAAGGGGGGGNWWTAFKPSAADFLKASGDATQVALTDDPDVGLIMDFNSAPVAGDKLRIAYETVAPPAADWSYEVRLTPNMLGVNYQGVGIIVGSSVSAKYTPLMMQNGMDIYTSRRSLTAYSNVTAAGGQMTGSQGMNPFFLKITYEHVAARFRYFMSADGKRWKSYPGFTSEPLSAWVVNVPDRVGLVLFSSYAGNVADTLSLVCDYRKKSW